MNHLRRHEHLYSLGLFAAWAALMLSCATAPPTILPATETTSPLVKAIKDWQWSSLGWMFYFDGYAPVYFTRQQLILALDPEVGSRPVGHFQASGKWISNSAEDFVRIHFQSLEQLNKFIDMRTTTWTP